MNRNFGLDFIRVVAILLVLTSHSVLNLDKELTLKFAPFGVFGVELFFVLSGFLIGQIIITDLIPLFSLKKLFHFWVRRWLRTLPLYYLILIFRLLFFNNGTNIHLNYFLFIQNFYFKTDGLWFGESWSLAIEEWFYFLIPIILYFILKIKFLREKIYIVTILIVLIFIIFLIKTLVVLHDDKINYTFDVRMFIPFRLDSLMIGVLLASIKIFYNRIYKWFSKPFIPIFSLFLFLVFNFIIGNILIYDSIGEKFWPSTIGLQLTGTFFALLIPFFEQNQSFNRISNNKIINFIITKISLFTYSVYLIHHLIFFKTIYHKPFSSLWGFELSVSLISTFFLAAIIYKFFEQPIMELRGKLWFHK